MRLSEIAERDYHNDPQVGHAVRLNQHQGTIGSVTDKQVTIFWDNGSRNYLRDEWIFYHDPYAMNGKGQFNMVGPFR